MKNQFVAGYSIHQQASDSACCLPHLEKLEKQSDKLPQNLITDSGYGCEETYEHLIDNGIGNYAKYGTFHQELKRCKKGNRFWLDDFNYDAQCDQFTCPAGRRLSYVETQKDQTKTSYEVEYRVCRSVDCTDCPLRDQCTRSTGNRTLSMNFRWQELKQQARQNLCTQPGLKLRAKRSVEIESVFGRIKRNWSFRRFMLRGIKKVNIEVGLLCIAHNLAKKQLCWLADYSFFKVQLILILVCFFYNCLFAFGTAPARWRVDPTFGHIIL